ncbi:MAG: hypothetical protein P8J51_02575 [Dehalococcoidia bacterium]|nr:hypothetical protein [Dehalococcoidia bacterium]
MDEKKELVGVIIWTQNFDIMSKFYLNTLMLEPKTIRNDFINFKWGKMKLSLAVHEDIQGKSKDKNRIMLNFEVKNIQRIYEQLLIKKVEFIRKPEDEGWGKVSSFLDPDENILQLLEIY